MKRFEMDGWVCRGANGAPGVVTRATQAGQLVTSFRVNSPDYGRDRQTTPAYFQMEYWHSGADDPKARLIQEGACLLMSGQVAYDTWQDGQTGQNRSAVKFKVHELGQIFAPGQAAAQPQPRAAQTQGYGQPGYPPQRPQAAPAARCGTRVPPQAPAPAQPAYAPQQAYAAPQQAPVAGVYDDEIPF